MSKFKWSNKLIISGVVGLIGFFTALNCFTIVPVGDEASVTSFGEIHEGKVLEGFNLVLPWWGVGSCT